LFKTAGDFGKPVGLDNVFWFFENASLFFEIYLAENKKPLLSVWVAKGLA